MSNAGPTLGDLCSQSSMTHVPYEQAYSPERAFAGNLQIVITYERITCTAA
jgi:hypothetical protein